MNVKCSHAKVYNVKFQNTRIKRKEVLKKSQESTKPSGTNNKQVWQGKRI